MHKTPRAKLNMAAQGRAKPRMSKADKDFIRGFACCLSNACSLEEWRPSQIGGGITIFDMRVAGVDENDIKIIERYLEK